MRWTVGELAGLVGGRLAGGARRKPELGARKPEHCALPRLSGARQLRAGPKGKGGEAARAAGRSRAPQDPQDVAGAWGCVGEKKGFATRCLFERGRLQCR